MATLEDVFIKEFKRNLKMGGTSKNIFDVPLPESVKSWEVSGEELYFVNGLNESSSGLYYGLNGTLVKKLPKNMVASRRKIDLVKRDFVKDERGRYVYEDVKVPKGSIVVISDKMLHLPFKYQCPDEGFGYIDFITDGKNKEFLYYVPKRYIYQTHQTALALSVKTMKNFRGKGYNTWSYGLIYLHIIPYKPNSQYVGSKILATDLSLNYTDKVKEIVDFWVENGVIADIFLSETFEGNLVLKETPQGYDDYNPFEELSIGDREIYGSDSMED